MSGRFSMRSAEFESRMKSLLKDRYPEYEAAIQLDPVRGFRLNRLKCTEEELRGYLDFDWKKNPYAKDSWVLPDEVKLYESMAYECGLFYVQETSASLAVEVLDPRPGMNILDLCAAPGSKSTQIAERMNHEGTLISNEYDASRSLILCENMEKHGAANVTVLNSTTAEIASAFPEYFDAVLVDAPCSGEGMMRKNPEAEAQWSLSLVHSCAERQAYIISDAYQALRPGGTLVYSTCTFNEEENEDTLLAFLAAHPDMHVVPIEEDYPHTLPSAKLPGALRVIPSDIGEGHFVCRMIKDGNSAGRIPKQMKSGRIPECALSFLKDQLEGTYPYLLEKNGRVYGSTVPFYQCGKCRIIRSGVLLGEVIKDRFEPSWHFYLSAALPFRHVIELNDADRNSYLYGMTVSLPCDKGWYGVSWNHHMFSGTKSDGRILKNKYPKRKRRR